MKGISELMSEAINTVLILSGDTDGNIGDRAIVFSMCDELKRINPDIKIFFISGNLSRDREFFGGFPIPRGTSGFLSLVKAARKSDIVLCGGGGLFQDDDSLIKMPYWALRLLFIRYFCKKIVGYSLGVGPLKKMSSRFFARLAFVIMDCISVRDSNAMQTAKLLTPKKIHFVPDPALLLSSAARDIGKKILLEHCVPLDGTPLIGVSLRRWFHQRSSFIPHKYAYKYGLRKIPGKKKCDKMTLLLANVLDRMITEHGAYIVFMPTYNVSHEADYQICQEVIDKMELKKSKLISIYDPRLYKAVTGYLSVMLGGRMHPAILSAGAGTPIVGLSYNQKFSGFFKLLGLSDNVISIEDFVNNERSNELVALIVKAIKNDLSPLPRVHAAAQKIRDFNEYIFAVQPS